MNLRLPILLATLVLPVSATLAGDLHRDAAIGGAIGGALGGVAGAELGGRQGAILGAGVGAALGSGIGTRDVLDYRDDGVQERHRYRERNYHPAKHGRSHGRFCPPGQAKKGRC